MSNVKNGMLNHQQLDCVLNSLLWLTTKKTSKYTLVVPCEGDSPVTSNAEGISNHQQLDCLFNCLFWLTTKNTWKHTLLPLCDGNVPVTNNVEGISKLCCHHDIIKTCNN